MRKTSVAGVICLAAFVFCVPNLWAYTSYNGGGDNCVQCHPGFFDKGPLHDLHVGSSQMTGNCLLCHTSIGDDPDTSSSGEGVGCIGCHMEFGLRLHHANAGAPPDAGGMTCAQCHPNDPGPPPEDALPGYYSRTDVNVKDSCQAQPAPPGEDFGGDGSGLDNDGDLLYDTNDPDCEVQCVDNDQDGYGNPASAACTFPQLDCNDSNENVNPGATEGPPGDATCSDELNNDCDGSSDLADPGCQEPPPGSCAGSAEASVYGTDTVTEGELLNLLPYLLVPVGVAIFLRIVRRKE